MRLDHADARHVHAKRLRQHQVHVVGHLRRGMHGHALAQRVVVGDGGVHLHLVLADLGAVIGALAHQVGLREALLDAAQFEQHVALDIAGLLLVQLHGARRQRVFRCVIGRQFAHGELDAAQRLARGRVVVGGDRRHRLAAVAHLVARQRVFAARDRQHAERLVAIGAGDHRAHAGQLQRLRSRRPRRSRRANRGCGRCGRRVAPAPRCRRCIWRGRKLFPARRSSARSRRYCAPGDLFMPCLRSAQPGEAGIAVPPPCVPLQGEERGESSKPWRHPLRAERGGEFHRLDDFHVAGAAADIAAERGEDFFLARVGILPQQSGRGHDEAGRAIAALRAELFVEAALHRRQLPVVSQATRWCRRACRQSVAANVRQESAGLSSISTVQAPHSPPSQPVLVPVSPAFSRRKSSNRMLSATASARSRPLSVNSRSRVKMFLPWSARAFEFALRLIMPLRHTRAPTLSRPIIGNGWYDCPRPARIIQIGQ